MAAEYISGHALFLCPKGGDKKMPIIDYTLPDSIIEAIIENYETELIRKDQEESC